MSPPSDAEKFRQHAAESRGLAERATTPEVKAGFNEIAEHWEVMAKAAEVMDNAADAFKNNP
jgi:hypothetical protein